MTEPAPEPLLHGELDGENTPEQSAALRQLLASRPQVRASYEELRRLAGALDGIPEVEPPPGLTATIMRAVRQRAGDREGWLATLRAAFARRPAFAHGFSLAAGAVLGGVLVGVAGPSSQATRVDGPSVSGTILPSGRLGALPVIDRERLGADGLQVEAVIRAGGEWVLAELEIASAEPLDVAVRFEEGAFAPVGLERSGGTGEVALGPEGADLRQVGGGTYRLVLGATGGARPPLRLRVGVGRLVLERVLKTG